jgi:hypothetical protein
VGETIGEANMNPTSSLLDVGNVRLPCAATCQLKMIMLNL